MPSRVVVKVALCVLASACVKVPDFQPRDGGGDGADAMGDGGMTGPLVNVVPHGMNDQGALASAPGYDMVFSDNGARLPYQLNLKGNPDQLIMGGSEQCADEYGMGIALFPVTRVNGVPNVDYGTPTLTIPLSGPYVGQVRVQWSVGFACPSSTSGAISGHSTFSFFPDGRLTRFDVVDNAGARTVTDCTACGPSSSNFYLSSYNTMIVDGTATLSDGSQILLAAYGDEVQPMGSACFRQRGYSVAFSWVDTQTRMRVVATGQARTIAFIKDMFQGATLPASGWAATTQMGISTEPCGQLEPRISQFSADDHQLTINGNSVGAALEDGIYGGDPRSGGYPVDFPVTLTPSATVAPRIPAGFAVWLHSTPTADPLKLTHSAGHTGNWYFEQHPDANSVVFWFNVPLEQGETITISDT